MPNVLGIDLGGKHVGLAVVEQPDNRVLWCGTVHLSDKIKDLYDQRRTLRRARRSRKRYRKPKVAERGGGAGGTGERATYFYSKAKGLNQSLRTKCKHMDPDTGEVCGKNTPKLCNVRHLKLEDILGFAPFAVVPEDHRQAIRDVLASRQGMQRRKERLKDILSRVEVAKYLKSQITDIILGDTLGSGRAQFCRHHLLAHHEQTTVPTQAAWLPPSIRLKQDFLLKAVRQVARDHPIHKVVIERAAFDLQKIAKGIIEDPTEYQQGHRYGFRNTRAALLQEYDCRCCYCGKSILGETWHVDHIDPRRTGVVIACDPCNHEKGGRTPEDWGNDFAVIDVRVAGRKIKRKLAPKPIDGTRIHKYMTQTDQGIRRLKRELVEMLGGVPIEETYGYVTAAWRGAWGLAKGKAENEHHNDAIVLASRHDADAPPIIEVTPQKLSQVVGGTRLFDLNPVQRVASGKHYQRTPVLAEIGGITPAQLKHVVDEGKRELLAREFERYGVKPKKTLPAGAVQRLPFKSVRLVKLDCTDTNVRAMRTGHRFKLSNSGGTRVNEAVAVYRRRDGKLGSYAVKNRRAFGPTSPPDDCDRRLWRFRPGELVTDADGVVLGRITKLKSDCTLTLDTGKTRAAHRCRKGGDPEQRTA